MVEATTTRAFDWGNSVEAIAFDPMLRRLLVSRHYGKIKMYNKTNGKIQSVSLFTLIWLR